MWIVVGNTFQSTFSEPATPFVESSCHPSYRPCVPSDEGDIDCRQLSSSVRVVGADVFGLDRDGDGVGCELND